MYGWATFPVVSGACGKRIGHKFFGHRAMSLMGESNQCWRGYCTFDSLVAWCELSPNKSGLAGVC